MKSSHYKHDSVFLNLVFSVKNGVDDCIAIVSTIQSSVFLANHQD